LSVWAWPEFNTALAQHRAELFGPCQGVEVAGGAFLHANLGR
jgi:hypothetical protein